MQTVECLERLAGKFGPPLLSGEKHKRDLSRSPLVGSG